jgi:hypothetical protein
VEDSCEHGNKLSGSIKYWEILEWLSDRRLPKKGLALWSELRKRNRALIWSGFLRLRIGSKTLGVNLWVP